MLVSKISTLAIQHNELKSFHDKSIHRMLTLRIKGETFSEGYLGLGEDNTALIMPVIRKAIMSELERIQKAITVEATRE